MTNRENVLYAAGLLLRRLKDLAHEVDQPGADVARVHAETDELRLQWKAVIDRVHDLASADGVEQLI